MGNLQVRGGHWVWLIGTVGCSLDGNDPKKDLTWCIQAQIWIISSFGTIIRIWIPVFTHKSVDFTDFSYIKIKFKGLKCVLNYPLAISMPKDNHFLVLYYWKWTNSSNIWNFGHGKAASFSRWFHLPFNQRAILPFWKCTFWQDFYLEMAISNGSMAWNWNCLKN